MHAQPNPPRRLAELPSWLLSRAAGLGAVTVGEALAAHGVRRHHFSVLHALAEEGSVSQAELGRRLGIDRSDLHAVLGELETSGAIARMPDPADRRRNTVTITSSGEVLLSDLDAAVDAAQLELLARLEVDERVELQRLLVKALGVTRVELRGELVCADEAQAEVVRAHLPRHIELTRAEPGCESFTVVPSQTPMVWVVEEVFHDVAAFRAHQLRVSSSDWGRATASIERRYTVSGV